MISKNSIFTTLLAILLISCSKNNDELLNSEIQNIDLELVIETDWKTAITLNNLVNTYRDSLGLNPIIIDNSYASALSVEHTFYMIDKNKISHDNFSERSNYLKNNGASKVGENVAFGYNTAEEVFHAYLNSPTHKNIIEGDYTYCGYGIIKNKNGINYYTQLFYKK